jgi:steroid delta-isomerase-like uncharacterized protein
MSEESKNVVRRFIEDGLNKADADVIAEVRSPDIVWHAGVLGEARGVDDLVSKISWIHESFPDLHVTIEDLIAEGDRVVARATVTGTHSGPVLGVPATGKRVMWSAIVMYRVEDGKIAEQWLMEDWASVLQQVGALPGKA